jgi:hypothetical protein
MVIFPFYFVFMAFQAVRELLGIGSAGDKSDKNPKENNKEYLALNWDGSYVANDQSPPLTWCI